MKFERLAQMCRAYNLAICTSVKSDYSRKFAASDITLTAYCVDTGEDLAEDSYTVNRSASSINDRQRSNDFSARAGSNRAAALERLTRSLEIRLAAGIAV